MNKVIRRVLTSDGFREVEVELPTMSEALAEVVVDELPEVVEEDILSMGGKELTAMCKALGISAAGSNSAKINRILEATKSGEDSL